MKALSERVGVIGAAGAVRRRGQHGATLVLAYHNVRPVAARAGGDASLHLDFDSFRSQLDQLQRWTRVVALEELLHAGVSGAVDAVSPRIAITFDDAYAGALELALPELVARRLPSTVFVAPALLGVQATWWDRYLGGVSPADAEARRSHALAALAGEADLIAAHAARAGWSDSIGARIATEAELARAASLPGVTLGAHTMTHPNLARVDTTVVERELALSMAWLRSRYTAFRPWLAYPYGLSAPHVEAAARDAGYTAAFLVDGGWTALPAPAFAHPRLNVPAGVSNRGFRIRLARR